MPTVINLNKDDFQSKTILDIHGIAPSICAGEGGNKLKVVYPMVLKMGCKDETYDERSEVPPLDSADSKHPVVMCYGICSFDSNSMKSPNPHSGFYEAKTSRTLDLNGGNPACNQGGVLVVAYQGQTCDTNTKRAYTLLNGRVDTHNITSVCYKSAGFVGSQGAKAGGVAFEMEKAPTLRNGITSDVVYCVLNDQGGR